MPNSRHQKLTLDTLEGELVVRTAIDKQMLEELSRMSPQNQNDAIRIAIEIDNINMRAKEPKWSFVRRPLHLQLKQQKKPIGTFRCRQTGDLMDFPMKAA